MDRKGSNDTEEKQSIQNINLHYIFSLVQHIILSASQAGTIAADFIKENGQEQLARAIYRDRETAKEAARIISEVAKLKTAYFGS
jgi:hypothetical protein